MTRKSKRLLPALKHVAIFLVLSCSLSEGNPTWLSQKMHENNYVERAQHSIEGKKNIESLHRCHHPFTDCVFHVKAIVCLSKLVFFLITMTIWSIRVSYSSGILHESSRI
jgi:hypothetical protein